MDAFHSLWTKPKNSSSMEEFELLTMLLSALKWREKNGKITLVTDSRGAEYISSLGISKCWDSVITALDNMSDNIDPVRFWAAGKIYALTRFDAPVVSVDTDFIVWDALDLEKSKSRICAIHSETLNRAVYPDMPFAYFDDGFSWEELPLNTAFVYYGDNRLKDEYIKYAFRFMESCSLEGTLQPMVFAEQRMLGMVSNKLGIKPDVFSSLEKLSSGTDTRFTHLWGFKNNLRENPKLKKEFESKLEARLLKDFGFVLKKA